MYCRKPAIAWCNFLILSFLISGSFGCSKDFDLESEADRLALKQEIRDALTVGNCGRAVELSNMIYPTKFTDNDVRYLYASSYACTAGVNFFRLVDGIVSGNLGVAGFWSTAVSLFPSRTGLDSKFQASQYAQDALQSIWVPNAIVLSPDLIYEGSFNPGSVWYQQRTAESNTLLFFNSLAVIGTGLNRYGYTSAQDPTALAYVQGQQLPWVKYLGDVLWAGAADTKATMDLLAADASGTACGIASGVLNMFDGLHQLSGSTTGATQNAINSILTNIEPLMVGPTGAATLACTTQIPQDPFPTALPAIGNTTQCAEALIRLRFRAACTESAVIRASAAGILSAIDFSWL